MDNEPFSSDTSDDDYVPTGADGDDSPLSEAEEVDDSLSGEDNDDDSSTKKGKLKRKRRSKKGKATKIVDEEPTKEEPQRQEDQKARIDSLWADFKKESNAPTKPKSAAPQVTANAATSCATKPSTQAPEKKVIFEFAGEVIKPEAKTEILSGPSSAATKPAAAPLEAASKRPPPVRSGGLASFTSQLQAKKQKLSTLEKSKMDWDSFKHAEGINEELKTFNQGKQGYLERQDFLQRTDVRQFERERNFRQTTRRNT